MGKAFVHVCDVCGKRIEDNLEYSDPAGWFHVRVTATVDSSYWKFLSCDECMKHDAKELTEKRPYFKRVCDLFKNLR